MGNAGIVLSDKRARRGTHAASEPSHRPFTPRHGLDGRVAFDAPDERLAYHGHSHGTALGQDHHAVAVLRRAGYAVDPLDTGCCGMAGNFGYEAEDSDLSRAIADLVLETVRESDAGTLVASGPSCRSQFAESGGGSWAGGVGMEGRIGTGDAHGRDRPPHPAELLERARVEGD